MTDTDLREHPRCGREDLIQERSLNEWWGVLDDGELDTADVQSDGGASEFSNYLCKNCEDVFERWADALKHIGMTETGLSKGSRRADILSAIHGQIVGLRPVPTKPHGNPKYAVRIYKVDETIELRTATNALFAYGVTEQYIGRWATFFVGGLEHQVLRGIEFDVA